MPPSPHYSFWEYIKFCSEINIKLEILVTMLVYANPPPPLSFHHPPRIKIMKIGGFDFVLECLFFYWSKFWIDPLFHSFKTMLRVCLSNDYKPDFRVLKKNQRESRLCHTFSNINPSLTKDFHVVRWSRYNYVYTGMCKLILALQQQQKNLFWCVGDKKC